MQKFSERTHIFMLKPISRDVSPSKNVNPQTQNCLFTRSTLRIKRSSREKNSKQLFFLEVFLSTVFKKTKQNSSNDENKSAHYIVVAWVVRKNEIQSNMHKENKNIKKRVLLNFYCRGNLLLFHAAEAQTCWWRQFEDHVWLDTVWPAQSRHDSGLLYAISHPFYTRFLLSVNDLQATAGVSCSKFGRVAESKPTSE